MVQKIPDICCVTCPRAWYHSTCESDDTLLGAKGSSPEARSKWNDRLRCRGGGIDESCRGDDCNDTDPVINPGMQGQDCSNAPDGVDNDCDGQIDEDDCGCFIGVVM